MLVAWGHVACGKGNMLGVINPQAYMQPQVSAIWSTLPNRTAVGPLALYVDSNTPMRYLAILQVAGAHKVLVNISLHVRQVFAIGVPGLCQANECAVQCDQIL